MGQALLYRLLRGWLHVNDDSTVAFQWLCDQETAGKVHHASTCNPTAHEQHALRQLVNNASHPVAAVMPQQRP